MNFPSLQAVSYRSTPLLQAETTNKQHYTSTPVRVDHLSRAAQKPKFKIPLPRSFVPLPIECQVSSTSAQRSQSQGLENDHTARTHGLMDGRLIGFTSHFTTANSDKSTF